MTVSKDAVAAVLLDLASQAAGFQIDVEEIPAGHGVPLHRRSKQRRHGPIAVAQTYEVTAEKLRDAAKRLARGHVHGPLQGEVNGMEVHDRLVIVFTERHRVSVRGRLP